MKRSYPYTGPGASPSQPQAQQMTANATPSAQQTPDYSSYGYGANSALMAGNKPSAGLSQEAQQAQWHQQWQQYYAQQAANTTGTQSLPGNVQNRPPHQLQQYQTPMHPSQSFGFQQQQQQQQYHGQQFPQQTSMPPAQQIPNAAPYSWPNQQQNGAQGFQQQSFNVASGQQQPANYHHANLPPAKRPRFELNGQQQNGAVPMRPMNPMAGPIVGPGFQAGAGGQAFPVAAGGQQNYPSNMTWHNGSLSVGPGPARMSPMRGGGISPHAGGPSNMAGPMAASPSGIRTPSMPRGPSRPGRPQAMPNRPMAPSGPSAISKFSGPVGVNSMSQQTRGGFGRPSLPVNLGARRPIVGLRNGIPSGPSGKGNRFDQGKGRVNNAGIKGSANKTPGELNKFPLRVDQPAPPSSKRTFSDFRIKAISIDPIDWQWQQDEEGGDEEDEAGGDEDETMQSTNDADSVNGSIQGSKKARLGKRKEKPEVSKEICRLRICFAANLPPPGVPTGPKALIKAVEREESEQSASSEVASNSGEPEWTAFSRGPPQSSTNRISISYASSKRRLVIDSDVIKSIEVNRANATLKIVVDVTTAAGVKRRDQLEKKKGEEWVIVKGVLLEGREAEMDNFGAISRRDLEKCWRMKGEEERDESEQTSDQMEEQSLDAEVVIKEEQEENDNGADEDVKEEVEDENLSQNQNQNQSGAEGEAGETESGAQLTVDDVEEEDISADADEAKAEEIEEEEVIWQDYTSLPPFFRLLARHDGPREDNNHSAVNSSEMIITVMLAEVSPKQELRWIKTGDVEEWLSALPGFQSSFSSTSGAKVVHAWTDKIHVVDPDPPPTVIDILQDWATKSFVGNLGDRRRFLEVHDLHSTFGMTDLICKLIRGERAVPTPNARELGASLKEAMEGNAFQQNHLTCSIMAIVRLMKEYAGVAGIEESVLEARIQEIFMCLPTHQIFRACDGLLKEYLEKQRLTNASRAKTGATETKRGVIVERLAEKVEENINGKGSKADKEEEEKEAKLDENNSIVPPPLIEVEEKKAADEEEPSSVVKMEIENNVESEI